MKSEIGLCVRTLSHKEWGKTFVFTDGSALRRGRIRSQDWWERRLKELVDDPTVITLILGPEPIIDYPPRDMDFENVLTNFYDRLRKEKSHHLDT